MDSRRFVDLFEREPLVEMARLGNMGNFSFWVYTEPLKNPSFHLRYGNQFEIVVQAADWMVLEIKFNTSRFVFKKGTLPPAPILKQIQTFFGAQSKDEPKINNAEAFRVIWKAVNPKT